MWERVMSSSIGKERLAEFRERLKDLDKAEKAEVDAVAQKVRTKYLQLRVGLNHEFSNKEEK